MIAVFRLKSMLLLWMMLLLLLLLMMMMVMRGIDVFRIAAVEIEVFHKLRMKVRNFRNKIFKRVGRDDRVRRIVTDQIGETGERTTTVNGRVLFQSCGTLLEIDKLWIFFLFFFALNDVGARRHRPRRHRRRSLARTAAATHVALHGRVQCFHGDVGGYLRVGRRSRELQLLHDFHGELGKILRRLRLGLRLRRRRIAEPIVSVQIIRSVPLRCEFLQNNKRFNVTFL